MHITFQQTMMTRQTEDTYYDCIVELPDGSPTVTVDVIDPQGEVGHTHIFRGKDGNLYAAARSLDPRDLYETLKAPLRLKTLVLAVRQPLHTLSVEKSYFHSPTERTKTLEGEIVTADPERIRQAMKDRKLQTNDPRIDWNEDFEEGNGWHYEDFSFDIVEQTPA